MATGVVTLAVAVVGKLVGCGLAALGSGMDWVRRLRVGSGMISRGEGVLDALAQPFRTIVLIGLLLRSANQQALHSINKGNCVAVPLIGQFWTVAASAELPVTL